MLEMAALIQSPAKCEARSVIRFLNAKVNAEEGDEFLDSIVIGDEIWGFHHTPESKQAGKKFDNDDDGSKGWWQTSMTREYRSWFQDLINVWTMPATTLKK
jgi:hypothetical protein